MPISSDDLRRTLEQATPGPWRKHGNGQQIIGDVIIATMVFGPMAKPNSRLIALTPDLAAEVLERRAQADRDRARIEALEGVLREIVAVPCWGESLHKALNDRIKIARIALANTASDNGGQHGHE